MHPSPQDDWPGNNSSWKSLLDVLYILEARLSFEERLVVKRLLEALPTPRAYSGLGRQFLRLATKVRDRCTPSAISDIGKLIIAKSLMNFRSTIFGPNFKPEVLLTYPVALTRIIDFISESPRDYFYPDDLFMKDLRIATGFSIPSFGAQDIDLRSNIGFKASATLISRERSIKYILSAIKHGQIKPWFRIHTDVRRRAEFNERGFDACYTHMAAMISNHPTILGMAATSWLYDPKLEFVSPRLSFVGTRPLERGASLIRSGTSIFDIQNAIATSQNRLHLYETGKYIPVSYTIIWPREKLISWANHNRK